MARKLPPVDVVLVGFGWTAAILAQELTDEGLEVLAIERGAWRDTPTHFLPPSASLICASRFSVLMEIEPPTQ